MGRIASLTATLAVLGIAPSASAQTTSDKGPERVICKKTQETGSLVTKRKQCHTQREWELMAQAARNAGQYEIDRQMTRSGGM